MNYVLSWDAFFVNIKFWQCRILIKKNKFKVREKLQVINSNANFFLFLDAVFSHLEEYEEYRLWVLLWYLLESISLACILAASWKWALSPSTGEGRLGLNTCTSLRVFPGAASFHWRYRQSRKPVWIGPPCKCSCIQQQKRSCCPCRDD